MRVAQGSVIFHSLYSNVNGYAVSNAAIENNRNKDGKNNFLYGEFPLITWYAIVKKANPKKDGVFFDLGSGVGRAPILSHLIFDFKKSIGIELLEGLHNKACELKERLEKTSYPKFDSYLKDRELSLINRNIFDVDLSEADFLFINYPLRGEKSFLQLEEKLRRELKPKTKIVTTIRKLNSKDFKMFCSTNYKFSWGRASAYFYEV